MRILILALVLLAASQVAFAEMGYVSGYSRSDGTYVQGHYKDTSADGNPYNNRGYLWGY
jgi:hypothetical protein